MNRKTNLFYSTGQDSNFVTFSNYTEELTGNILSTNTKLFPSKFICMYIPELDKETNEDFIEAKKDFIINYLVGYYENKLATLRDKVDQSSIHPLDYLYKTIFIYDESSRITFNGNICEQEYNGYFMDNICIIENNANPINKKIVLSENSSDPIEGEESLHGWAGQSLPPEYDGISPKFDTDNYYSYDITTSLKDDTAPESSIKFNVLVPLFRIYKGYLSITNAEINESNEYEDIPLGMWFSDKVIILDRTTLANYSYRPSWSICISSQFKPFPYGSYPNEIPGYDEEDYDDSSSYESESHRMPNIVNTFAMIMAKQAYLENKADEIDKLKARIETLESIINNQ